MKLFWKLCGEHNLSGGLGHSDRASSEVIGIGAASGNATSSVTNSSPAQKLKGDDSWIALLVALSPFIAAIVISIIHGLIT